MDKKRNNLTNITSNDLSKKLNLKKDKNPLNTQKSIKEHKKKNGGIIAMEERGQSAWIGASRISTWGNFDTQWISRNEYFSKGLVENDYLFNYSGLNDKQKNQMIFNNDINPDEIYKKYIMREQI